MGDHIRIAAFVLDKVYDIIYTDTGGNQRKARGKLISTNHDGFVVIENAAGKAVLIPKDRVDSLEETDPEEQEVQW